MKPRAKAGQVILSLDLGKTGDVEGSLGLLLEMGYTPSIRNVELKSGMSMFAIIKDEQHSTGVGSTYLMDEWLELRKRFNPACVHLWRGYSSLSEAKAS